jgi:hypothetical protein
VVCSVSTAVQIFIRWPGIAEEAALPSLHLWFRKNLHFLLERETAYHIVATSPTPKQGAEERPTRSGSIPGISHLHHF